MVDFIKIAEWGRNPNTLLDHPELFNREFRDTETGNISYFDEEETIQGITLNSKNGKDAFWRGSIHKYHQDGTNFDRLPYPELFASIRDFCLRFGVDPIQAELQGFEFGVNLHGFPHSFRQIERNLLTFKGLELRPFNTRERGTGRRAEMQQYHVKIYDKGRQYKLKENVIRFEVKVKRMTWIKTTGIRTLADLLCPGKLTALASFLVDTVAGYLMFDDRLRGCDLKPSEARKLEFWKLPGHWLRLKEEDSRKHARQRRTLRKLIARNLSSTYQDELKEAVRKEWFDLLKFDQKTAGEVRGFLQRFSTQKATKLTGLGYPKSDEFNTSSIWLNKSLSIRTCKTCGKDISHRRRDAIFCSSKACRNADSNPRLTRRRKYGVVLSIGLSFYS